jgi:hypothetical protein
MKSGSGRKFDARSFDELKLEPQQTVIRQAKEAKHFHCITQFSFTIVFRIGFQFNR